MSLKHKIMTTMMFGAPALFGGCNKSYDFIVDGKADNKIVVHYMSAPRDTSVVMFKPYNYEYYEYYEHINIGDTITMQISRFADKRIVINNLVRFGPLSESRLSHINNKTLREVKEHEKFKSMQKEKSRYIRSVMSKSEKSK